MELCQREAIVSSCLALSVAGLLPAAAVAQGSAAACPAPVVDTVGWRSVYTPDSSVAWSLPPHFILEAGSWRAADGRWFGVSVIDLFANRRDVLRAFSADPGFLADSGPAPHIFLLEDLLHANWLPEGSAAIRVGDGFVVREHSACREALSGVPALIEAGLISGGFSGVRDAPAVQVTLRPSWGTLVIAGGQAVDLVGQRELLAIARTVRVRWR